MPSGGVVAIGWRSLCLVFSVELTNSRWTSTSTSSLNCSACTSPRLWSRSTVPQLCPKKPPMRICGSCSRRRRGAGLTHFICSSFDIIFWIFWRVHAPTDFCPCGTYHTSTSASLSPDSKLLIYFGTNANPMALHLSGLCVCHHDTPVPNENTTSLQPSTSLRPSSPPTRLPCTRQHSCPCAVWLDSELCSRARPGGSTLDEICSRHNDTSSVSKGCSLTASMFWQALQRTQHHWEPTSPICREDKFRHPCCDHTGECAFRGSVVARRELCVDVFFLLFFPQTA